MYNRIYIHVPFCLKKCHYCAFTSQPPQGSDLTEYPQLLLRELSLHPPGSRPLTSIYFGGDTPSLLAPGQISTLLDGIAAHMNLLPDAEITLEANPGSTSFRMLQQFREAGINRLSLGIQSLDNDFLHLLGRIHTADQAAQVIQDARSAGFSNISLDLIHSLPGQKLHHWQRELEQVIALAPEHLSIYGLTVEEGTPLARTYSPDHPELPDEDLGADMFELADSVLTDAGYAHYEIANYAKNGFTARHNSGYWKRDGYLGLGVAAHSFLQEDYGVRFHNHTSLAGYRQEVANGVILRQNEQRLTRDDAMAEYLFLGLRVQEGIDTEHFAHTFGRSLESLYGTTLAELVSLDLLLQDGNRYALTRRGMLLSNQVFSRFI